jgi:hypothetical protein
MNRQNPAFQGGAMALPKPRLFDQVRDCIRTKHYSIRTKQSQVDWIRRFILFPV